MADKTKKMDVKHCKLAANLYNAVQIGVIASWIFTYISVSIVKRKPDMLKTVLMVFVVGLLVSGVTTLTHAERKDAPAISATWAPDQGALR